MELILKRYYAISLSQKVYWILRLAVVGCFFGHGAFGIITKEGWLPFFAVAGIGADMAFRFMPIIGIMDITLAFIVAFRPCRVVLLWMAVWGLWTAALRPLSGTPIWELFERAGNYGVPLAFLALSGWFDQTRSWISKIDFVELTQSKINELVLILTWTTGLLMIGHGGFGAFMQKQMLIDHFASVGIFLTPSTLAAVGWFEILLGLAVIIKPFRPMLLTIFVWKVSTELLYPLSGDYIFEFIERAGSYGAPLALYFLLDPRYNSASNEQGE